ncbi:MAG TPA: hypothetical protein VNK96_06350 [Fimbriimonadales bacterium]|nr:hypothetical protein [Fimbriimonadales bacterium]
MLPLTLYALFLQSTITLPSNSDAKLSLKVYPLLENSRICPKYRWEYPFKIEAHADKLTGEQTLRFRIYTQSNESLETSISISRVLLHLWELANSKLSLEHPLRFRRTIDVFLASGGKSGAEQGIFFGPDENGFDSTQLAIYIYDIKNLSNSIETLREIAHEYGHAILPPIGTYKEPEPWSNGYLGEKLFLMMLLEALEKKNIRTEDLLNANQRELEEWVKKNAFPLANKIWRNGIEEKELSNSMDSLIGFALYTHEAFPRALSRGLRITGGAKPGDLYRAIRNAIEERTRWEIEIPSRLANNRIWLFLDKHWKIEGAKVITRNKNGMLVECKGKKIIAKK